MIRRFCADTFTDAARLARWLNEMGELPEGSPARRHHSSRQLKIESISAVVTPGETWYLAVISRLEDDDE